MTWPHSTDYFEAIQSPATNFSDPELRQTEPAVNALGLPVACSGNFADVYHLRAPDGRRSWAVKCFTRPVPRLKERYREISRHLEQARLPFLVDFQFLEQGIRVRGEWYPVLKMDWVEGQTLNEFVREQLDEPETIELMLQLWLKIEPRLHKAQIAHGDLQHGNILLVPGSREDTVALKLVDYDGMWVPSLAGIPSGEVGHPSYQHPERSRKSLFTPDVDRFPHFVIALALRCLSQPEGRQLWKTYDSGENLLFSRPDLEVPAKSKLLRNLWNTGDRELHAWVGHLVIASQSPLEATPLLSKLLTDVHISPLSYADENSVRTILGVPTPVPGWSRESIDPGGTPGFERDPIVENDPDQQAIKRLWSTVAVGVVLILGVFFAIMRSSGTGTHPETSVPVPAASNSQSTTKQQGVPNTEIRSDWVQANVRRSSVLAGHTGVVNCVAFSPDGQRLASASTDRTVKLWDMTTGQEIQSLKGHTSDVMSVAFSPDGQRLASASRDKTVKVWNANTGDELLTLSGHTGGVMGVAFGLGGQRVASASTDQTVKVWDATTGQDLLTLKGHNGTVQSVAFSPDSQRLVSASWDVVKVWDVISGQESLTLAGQTPNAMSVMFSRDGHRLASAGLDGTVNLWDAMTGVKSHTHKPHSHGIMGVAFSSDGDWLASGGWDQTVRVWNATTGQSSLTLKVHPLAGTTKPSLQEVSEIREVGRADDSLPITSVAFSPDGRRIAAASADRTIRLWEVDRTGGNGIAIVPPRQPIPKPADSLGSISPSPSKPLESPIAKTEWIPGNVRELANLTGHTREVGGVAFSADGQRLASASDDQTVKVWDAASGQETLTLNGHSLTVRSAAFSVDGQRLASASFDQTLKVWDATNGQETLTLKGHTGQVTSVAFSKDGQRLASASLDPTVKVWDATSGQ
ncbi:MAG: hypothetical protein HZA46_19640 [Planctomycetales bacterium]|nr:hypothetical protein [Planctomycetales bacterium]